MFRVLGVYNFGPGKTRRYFFPLFSLNVVKCKNDSNEVNSNNFPCHGIHILYISHIVEYSMVMEFEVPYLDKKVDDFYPFLISSLKSYSSQTILYCFATNLWTLWNKVYRDNIQKSLNWRKQRYNQIALQIAIFLHSWSTFRSINDKPQNLINDDTFQQLISKLTSKLNWKMLYHQKSTNNYLIVVKGIFDTSR